MTTLKLKTPISYYGGKQRLASKIIKLFPEHIQYVEPFFGGGAVFFLKERSQAEVINDSNGAVTNFYYVAKTNFTKLQKYIKSTLHSEISYRESREILQSPMKNKIQFAWAFWVQTNMAFSNCMFGGFSFCNSGKTTKAIHNKKENFDNRIVERLEKIEIFNRDALDLIKLKDKPETFFYLDPPYVSANQGHYKGYTLEDFEKLLEILSKLKGKFLLSSYPEDILLEYRAKFKWNVLDESLYLSAGKVETRKSSKKTECLTYNYNLN